MSDPASVAKSARESLSKGLQALQTDGSVPPNLKALAEPIAGSMGALLQIERSNGAQLVPFAQTALEGTRSALSQLQPHANTHPAVAKAVEAVASSLSLIHQLGKLAGVTGQQHAAQGAFPQAAPPHAASPQQVSPQVSPQQHQAPPQAHFAPPAPQAAPYQAAPAAAPMASADPFAAPARPQAAPAPQGGGTGQLFNADLGAQSPTNFYKGLSGNDIVDHGGLFVSTYMVPKIGTPVRLKVSLPGGYEFEAEAVVRWSRDAGPSGDGVPGFGAQFTQITQEARQLVYRYVRNREPLFHDDL